jgi:hypothetical protein
MKRLLIFLPLCAGLLAGAARAHGQPPQTPTTPPQTAPSPSADPAAVRSGVIGEVTAVEPSALRLTLKTDAGASLSVTFNDKTLFRRIPPGETSTSKAVRITFAEVEVGDRVYAQGEPSADGQTLPARQLLVMSKEDLARRQERERVEWREKGIVGVVAALNPETKEITLRPGAGGAGPLVVEGAGAGVQYRRYPPDSVKFADTKPSQFGELKVGDLLRARGSKSGDGTRFRPDQVVSGSFRTVGGTVLAVDAQLGEIKVVDLQTRQPLTIAVNADSQLRRMEPQQAAAFARAGRPAGGAAPAEAPPDFQSVLERQPALKLEELKPGDLILVSSTKGANPSRLTAIAVVAGMDALLKQVQPARPGAPPSVVMGLPSDIPLP